MSFAAIDSPAPQVPSSGKSRSTVQEDKLTYEKALRDMNAIEQRVHATKLKYGWPLLDDSRLVVVGSPVYAPTSPPTSPPPEQSTEPSHCQQQPEQARITGNPDLDYGPSSPPSWQQAPASPPLSPSGSGNHHLTTRSPSPDYSREYEAVGITSKSIHGGGVPSSSSSTARSTIFPISSDALPAVDRQEHRQYFHHNAHHRENANHLDAPERRGGGYDRGRGSRGTGREYFHRGGGRWRRGGRGARGARGNGWRGREDWHRRD